MGMGEPGRVGSDDDHDVIRRPHGIELTCGSRIDPPAVDDYIGRARNGRQAHQTELPIEAASGIRTHRAHEHL